MRSATPMRFVVGLAALVLLAACTGEPSDPQADIETTPPTTREASPETTSLGETGSTIIGPDGRRAELRAPSGVDAPAPLLIALHGYWMTPDELEELFALGDQATSRGMYLLLPTGTAEAENGRLFWNASSACCDYLRTGVDDVAYLEALLDEAVAVRPIDPARVFVFGYSNGGFMAYRLACESADRIAAMVVVAGADADQDIQCRPDGQVSIRHLHGDADRDVSYDGGTLRSPEIPDPPPYPGARETVERWADRNGCGSGMTDSADLDLIPSIQGAETELVGFLDCDDGVAVELGTMRGAAHEPGLAGDAVGVAIVDWLLATG
ncbi:MAG: alpha/beta hydrolase family esterase [Acidimicrobiales bacterium]